MNRAGSNHPRHGRGALGARLAGRAAPSLLFGALALASCKEEPPAPEAAPEVPAEKKPAVDEKIASAMAAAEATARSEAQRSEGQLAPPPDGILSAEAAAKELAPGSAAQLVLGADGAAPRVRLGAERLTPGAGPNAKLSVSYRSGGSMMPTIELELKSKVAAGSAETAPASVPAGPAGASAAGNLLMRFTLGAARPADDQPGRLPENAKAEIAKLNGSAIERVALPSGALLAQTQKLAGNNPDLEPLVTGSAEALSSVLLPYPEVPVGAGAFWMLKSRETANGAQVLAYRMVKLVELGPTHAKLTVNTRRYLLDPVLPTAGLPPHRVRRFESEGEASIGVRPGALFPDSAEVRDAFMALVTPDDRPSQAVPIQSELSARIGFSR
jgi:hypothetical protein